MTWWEAMIVGALSMILVNVVAYNVGYFFTLGAARAKR